MLRGTPGFGLQLWRATQSHDALVADSVAQSAPASRMPGGITPDDSFYRTVVDARDADELNRAVAGMFKAYTGRNVAVDLTPNDDGAGADPLYESKVLAITAGHQWGLTPGKLAPDSYGIVPTNLPVLAVPGHNSYTNTLDVAFDPRHRLFREGQEWVGKYARRLGLDRNDPIVSPLHVGLHENVHTPAMRHDPAHTFLPDKLTADQANVTTTKATLKGWLVASGATEADAARAAELWRQLDRVEPDSAEYSSAAQELGRLAPVLWNRDQALLTWHAHRELQRSSRPHPSAEDPRWAEVDDARVQSDVSPYAAANKREALGESGVDVSLFGHDASDTAKVYVDASPLDLDAFADAADGLVATAVDFAGRVDPATGRERRAAPSRAAASRAHSSGGTDPATIAGMSAGERKTATRMPRTSLLAGATDVARTNGTHTAQVQALAVLPLLADTFGPVVRTSPAHGRASAAGGSSPLPSPTLRNEAGLGCE